MKVTSRRRFLETSIKGTAVITLGMGSMGNLLSSCANTKNMADPKMPTGFQQKPLPYAYDALEDVIDAKTMEIHYSKHAAAYAKNLDEAAKAEGVNMNEPLEKVLSNISRYSEKMRNNGGGHYNHELFWQCMQSPKTGNTPAGQVNDAINKSFGSFESFQKEFNTAATSRFGSGWAWLYADKNKTLKIGSTPNQDNPLMNVSNLKGVPILGLDVWEHAYYLKYQNKRADYITNWWKVVNWEHVNNRYISL
jgi:Fe-Mn family superoxide dismutase